MPAGGGGDCREDRLLHMCPGQLNGAAFTIKVILYFLNFQSDLTCQNFFKLPLHRFGIFCVLSLSACEICKIETVQYVYFVNLPFL